MTLPKIGKKQQEGFTLIELLVVIAVLGILAAVVLVAIDPTERFNEARDSGRKSDLNQVANALEAYYTGNNGSYPADLATLGNSSYIKQVPDTVNPSATSPCGAWNSATRCGYDTNSDNSEMVVWTQLEAASESCAGGAYKHLVYRSSTGSPEVECYTASQTLTP